MKKRIIYLSVILFGIVMLGATNDKIKSFFDFTGGINTRHSANLIKDSQCVDTKNLLYDDKLGLLRRDGSKNAFNLPVGTNTKIMGGYEFIKDNGSSYFLVQAGSTVFFSTGKDNWTVIKTGLSAQYPVDYATHYNKVWMTNGINDVFVFDGNITNTYTFVPKSRYILSAKDRLWMPGTLNNASSIFVSDINVDPITSDDWDEQDEFRVGVGDGQTITGILEKWNIVWVFKERSIHKILGNSTTVGVGEFTQMQAFTGKGAASQNAVLSHSDMIIFGGYDGINSLNGNKTDWVGEPIDNETGEIGLFGASFGKWSITSTADFSTGTWDNCWNDYGTIKISTSHKEWTSTVDFSTASFGIATQETVKDGGVQISTESGGETAVDLKFFPDSTSMSYYNSSWWAVTNNDRICVETYQPPWGGWSFDDAIDGDDSTYVAVINPSKTIRRVSYAFDSASVPISKHISKIRIKYQWALNWGTWVTFPSGALVYSPLLSEEVHWQADWAKDAFVEVMKSNWDSKSKFGGFLTEKADVKIPHSLTINIKDKSSYSDSELGYPQIVGISFKEEIRGNVDDYVFPALKIYELEAWTDDNIVYFSSAIYVSPIYNSGQITTEYKNLYISDDRGLGNSTGTVVVSARSDDDDDMSSPTNWYELTTDSATNTAIDDKQYFQWKADLWTSSITATPVLRNATLKYLDVGIATYTSKVNYCGRNLDDWGSFVADNEGTVSYEIRSATWSFDLKHGSGSGVGAWSSITSGSDITISTNNVYVQVRGQLASKDAEIKAINLTWFKKGDSTSGAQDVATISYNGRCYIACSTWTTHNDIIYILDINGAWTKFDNLPVSAFVEFDNKFYACSSTQPVILELETGDTDSGVYYSAERKSGHTDLGYPDRYKQLRYLLTTGEVQSGSFINFNYYVDESTNSSTIYVDLSSERNKRNSFETMPVGKNFYFVPNSTAPFNLQGYSLHFTVMPLR